MPSTVVQADENDRRPDAQQRRVQRHLAATQRRAGQGRKTQIRRAGRGQRQRAQSQQNIARRLRNGRKQGQHRRHDVQRRGGDDVQNPRCVGRMRVGDVPRRGAKALPRGKQHDQTQRPFVARHGAENQRRLSQPVGCAVQRPLGDAPPGAQLRPSARQRRKGDEQRGPERVTGAVQGDQRREHAQPRQRGDGDHRPEPGAKTALVHGAPQVAASAGKARRIPPAADISWINDTRFRRKMQPLRRRAAA